MARHCFHAQHCGARVLPFRESCQCRWRGRLVLPSRRRGTRPTHHLNRDQQPFHLPSNLQTRLGCHVTSPCWLQREVMRVLQAYTRMLPRPPARHAVRTISRLMLLSRTSIALLVRYSETFVTSTCLHLARHTYA